MSVTCVSDVVTWPAMMPRPAMRPRSRMHCPNAPLSCANTMIFLRSSPQFVYETTTLLRMIHAHTCAWNCNLASTEHMATNKPIITDVNASFFFVHIHWVWWKWNMAANEAYGHASGTRASEGALLTRTQRSNFNFQARDDLESEAQALKEDGARPHETA